MNSIPKAAAVALLAASAAVQAAPLFSDDFNDGNAAGWSFHGLYSGNWSVSGGVLQHGGGYTGAPAYALIDGIVTPDHFLLEADVRIVSSLYGSDWGHVGLIWGVDPGTGNFNTSYLRTHQDRVTSWSTPYAAGGERFLDTPGATNGNIYHLAVDVNYFAQQMTVTMGGWSTTFSGADFALLNQNSGGGIGLISWADNVTYDNVVLTALPVPEPSTTMLLLAGLGLLGFAARRRAGA
ncbi:MAG: PEP-CTERM sorting domain-containing protein [Rhodocyclaceae bacterium]|nr:PEP-CTERM sorting domain-containing protein [Rhodocyclaceae bacterium]